MMPSCAKLLAYACVVVAGLTDTAEARLVTLSNTQLPVDQHGDPIRTGEADVLVHNGTWFVPYTYDVAQSVVQSLFMLCVFRVILKGWTDAITTATAIARTLH